MSRLCSVSRPGASRLCGWSSAKRLGTLVVGACLAGAGPASGPAGAQQPSTPDSAAVARTSIDRPAAHLGFGPGADRRLAGWDQIASYLETLARQSSRVRIDTIGRSTLDRPMVMLTVTDSANLEHLEEIRAAQARLADPRTIADSDERAELIRRGRLIVLITAGIHPTEVGGPLTVVRLAHRLATAADSASRRILSECVILLVPALNPDGVDIVTDWYRESMDMPWEGTSPPFLYHHYVGHDLNRDWYGLTQIETRNVVARVHRIWHPQVVHDLHQQRANRSRYFVPPWLDPIEPNVDPLLVAATNALGTGIAWELQRQGRTGVIFHARYDAWTPSRAYPHYHAGVRVLSETASARLASPIEVAAEDLSAPGRSWNQPAPWPGGAWTLGDVVDYMESGALALLRLAAAQRPEWLHNFVTVGERAVAGWPEWPRAWVIPGDQENRAGVAELARILLEGEVEVLVADSGVEVDGETFSEGSLVVPMRQPYASFAQALLSNEPYPPALEAPEEDPAHEPYDVTSHNLPLLLGVEVVAVPSEPVGELRALVEPPAGPPARYAGVSDEPGVMVGLYRAWFPVEDEGWTRWLFDRYRVPYAGLSNADLQRGALGQRLTAIVLPDSDPEVLDDGWETGAMPSRYVGGIGPDGVSALRDFVTEGGTLVALGRSAGWAVERLGLPVVDRLREQPRTLFYSPGALVRLAVDPTTFVGSGMPPEVAGWVEGGLAFDVEAGADAARVASYGRRPSVLSGWVRGVEVLAGSAAVLDVALGRGRVVLFGIRPQFRGHSMATFPLLFNALRRRLPGR